MGKRKEKKDEIETVEVPEDFDFDELRRSATQILAEHSLATMSGLVRAASIERDDEYVPTACIGRRGRRLVIKYNGPFVYTYARKPMEFAGLLAHEIFHELLRHLDFSKYKGNQEAWNVAQDAIIQSTLHQMNKPPAKHGYYSYYGGAGRGRPFPGFHITALMEKFYKLEGISALLRPPHPLGRISSRETTNDPELDSMRKSIYRRGPAAVNEVDVYRFIMRKYAKDAGKVVVIGISSGSGSHVEDQDLPPVGASPDQGDKEDEEKDNGGGKDAKEKEDTFREGAGDLISEPAALEICKETDKMAGCGSTLTNSVKEIVGKKNKQLESALDKALIDSVKAKIVAGIGAPSKPGRSVVIPPQISRSDLIKMAGGVYPLFFNAMRNDGRRTKCRVYIDVSGSSDAYIGWMYGCIIDLTRVSEVESFLFSTKVVPVTMDDIKAGNVKSTGGTSFDCIAEHSLLPDNSEVKKILIFTDGYANMNGSNKKALKDNGISCIGAVFAVAKYTGNGEYNGTWHRAALEEFCVQVFDIPYLEGDI